MRTATVTVDAGAVIPSRALAEEYERRQEARNTAEAAR